MLPAVGYSAVQQRTQGSITKKFVTALHVGQSVVLVACLRQDPESLTQVLGDHNETMIRIVDLAKLAKGLCDSPDTARVVGFGDRPGLVRVFFCGHCFNMPMNYIDWLQVHTIVGSSCFSDSPAFHVVSPQRPCHHAVLPRPCTFRVSSTASAPCLRLCVCRVRSRVGSMM